MQIGNALPLLFTMILLPADNSATTFAWAAKRVRPFVFAPSLPHVLQSKKVNLTFSIPQILQIFMSTTGR